MNNVTVAYDFKQDFNILVLILKALNCIYNYNILINKQN